MSFSSNITKRKVRGLEKYVLNFRHPRTGKRTQRFFSKYKKAQQAQRLLYVDFEEGNLLNGPKKDPTVREAFDNWIEDRRGEVKQTTIQDYLLYKELIVGPLRLGSPAERSANTKSGKSYPAKKLATMLGDYKISELTTAEIRSWHKLLQKESTPYKADKAKQYLGTLMSQAAEDFNIRPPSLPRRNGKKRIKEKKNILTPEQVSILLEEARSDEKRGIYYAFPFLTGVRPSEQLAILWEDVDLEKRVIKICRMQEVKTGEITNFTKTEAGTREIPISDLLFEMLKDWKERCPRSDYYPQRVFPSIGRAQRWPLPVIGGGGPLLYSNFRERFWKPVFKELELPYVTPHSARHSFISNLQAQGVEVGLVAKLAGHSDPSVTIGHYTQAVRGGKEAIQKLDELFQNKIS